MGSCAYCGQGIAECHEIHCADGRKFIVGSDCVARVHGDDRHATVLTLAEAAAREHRNARAKTRRDAKADESAATLAALLADPAVRVALGHPERKSTESCRARGRA